MGLKHIKHIKEEVYSDPFYANDVFKIRYRQLGDLSNKKGSDLIQKPMNDLLDQFQEGDVVAGKGLDDDKEHIGTIVHVQKDEKGENEEISVEEDGVVFRLAPSSVKFAEDGDKGHRGGDTSNRYNTASNVDLTMPNFNTFAPFVYEDDKDKPLKNLKRFSDF